MINSEKPKLFQFRETTEEDLPTIMEIHRQAFGQEEEAELVQSLIADPTVQPYVSLLALANSTPVGHILFTSARLQSGDLTLQCSLLASLAVIPAA